MGLDPVLKDTIVQNLEHDCAQFSLYEEAEKKQRFIRPWVQSSPLTDRLGRNSRLLKTVVTSVENSLDTQARASTGPKVEVTDEVKYIFIPNKETKWRNFYREIC